MFRLKLICLPTDRNYKKNYSVGKIHPFYYTVRIFHIQNNGQLTPMLLEVVEEIPWFSGKFEFARNFLNLNSSNI